MAHNHDTHGATHDTHGATHDTHGATHDTHGATQEGHTPAHAHGHSHRPSHDGGTHSHGHDHAGAEPHGHMAEMLDLDVEVLHDYHREVITWAASLVPDNPRIIDLGAGTGTGTLALARHLPTAHVTAVDVDQAMLDHVASRAAEAGLTNRIDTVQADLDTTWPALGPADLIWASASMHHMADPAHTVNQAYAALTPGGVFMITELDSFPTFLPDPEGAALESRCHAELAKIRQDHGMHMSENWAAHLTSAGFKLEQERRFDIALPPPPSAATTRYAQISLQRIRQGLADRLSPDDLSLLDTLLPHLLTRQDLTVQTTRTTWTARRP